MAWETKNFKKCISTIKKVNDSVPKKDFLEEGMYPIISQEKEFINGYWNDESFINSFDTPIIIFGDHTKVIKYIDFDFILGADGTKIIKPINEINPRFFYYSLKNLKLENLGYARHYKLLKEKYISYPTSLTEQEAIVSYLDDTFEKIEQCKENIKQNIINAKELFQSKLNLIFKGKKHWETKTLGEVCKTSSGGTPLKTNKNYYENGKIPWLLSGEVNNKNITTSANFITEEGLKNSSAKLFPPKTILIAMYGATAGQVGILNFECSTNQAVCGIYPNNKIHYNYIYYYFLNVKEHLKSQAVGNAQPNISQEKIKKTIITYPTSLSEQEAIVKELDKLSEQVDEIVNKYQQKLQLLDDLKSRILEQVFTPKNYRNS